MQKINFVAADAEVEEHIPMPKPAKFFIPEWYKKAASFYDYDNDDYTNSLSFVPSGGASSTIKTCIPYLDTLTMGYMQETWCDIFIERKKDIINYHYSQTIGNLPILSHREINSMGNIPIPDGFEKNVLFNWSRLWNPFLPKGYSSLITHPMNRDDLPFRCFSGVIDSDKYFSKGKVGFLIKDGFSGLIPKGTPMYQIIPFKRDSWKTEKDINKDKIIKMVKNQDYNVRSLFYGGYKKFYWDRKDFS